MDSSWENVRKALTDLVARKDASIFQNLETFEQAIRKIGNWPLSPEIAALRAGLQQRLPWELQKASAGQVPAKNMTALAANLAKQHNMNEQLAVWAVESWAIALNLKYEKFTLAPAPAVAPTPAPASAVNSATPTATTSQTVVSQAPADFSVSGARVGVVFGLSEGGLIKVFKSWSKPAPSNETAGMVYTPIKVEEQTAKPLFAAAPKPKTPVAKAPAKTTTAAAPVQAVKPAAVAPNLHAAQPQVKTTVAPPPIKAQTPAVQPGMVRPVSPPPVQAPAAPRVYNGSAEELFAQAQSLMPGFGSRVNMGEALELLTQSAKMGYVPARRKIGEIYLKGLGVKTDCSIAAGWFRQAADAGDAQAQFHLGSLYQCGMGVEFNLTQAQEWLSRAANQGHQEARDLLNQMLQA